MRDLTPPIVDDCLGSNAWHMIKLRLIVDVGLSGHVTRLRIIVDVQFSGSVT